MNSTTKDRRASSVTEEMANLPKPSKPKRPAYRKTKRRKSSKTTATTPRPAQRPCPTCSGAGTIPDKRKDFSRVEVKAIAKAVGRSSATISRMFSSDPEQWRDTKFSIAIKVTRYLGITLDELAAIIAKK